MKTFAGMLLLLLPIALLQEPDIQEPDRSPQVRNAIPVPDDLAIERRDFMRTKLMFSQNIFEGLTIRDFVLIEQGVAELEQISAAEQWVAIDNEDYRRLTDEFKTSLARLKISAESKNIEATALRFYEMSTRCIDCHQHLRHAKYQF